QLPKLPTQPLHRLGRGIPDPRHSQHPRIMPDGSTKHPLAHDPVTDDAQTDGRCHAIRHAGFRGAVSKVHCTTSRITLPSAMSKASITESMSAAFAASRRSKLAEATICWFGWAISLTFSVTRTTGTVV